jgi:hypothetical protein
MKPLFPLVNITKISANLSYHNEWLNGNKWKLTTIYFLATGFRFQKEKVAIIDSIVTELVVVTHFYPCARYSTLLLLLLLL